MMMMVVMMIDRQNSAAHVYVNRMYAVNVSYLPKDTVPQSYIVLRYSYRQIRAVSSSLACMRHGKKTLL